VIEISGHDDKMTRRCQNHRSLLGDWSHTLHAQSRLKRSINLPKSRFKAHFQRWQRYTEPTWTQQRLPRMWTFGLRGRSYLWDLETPWGVPRGSAKIVKYPLFPCASFGAKFGPPNYKNKGDKFILGDPLRSMKTENFKRRYLRYLKR